MSTRISNLPSDCVQLIFDRIPTHQLLLHIRRVCHAWQRNQQLNCRRRKSLIIFHGKESFKGFINQVYNKPFIEHKIDQNGNSKNHNSFIEYNQILILGRKKLNVEFLVSTFPHLHTLIVSTDCILSSQYVQSFILLITGCSAKLVTLQLYFDGSGRDRQASVSIAMGNLITKLNSLTLLQNLIFQIADWSINPPIEKPEFLTRVKKFYFDFNSSELVMLDWAREYGQAGRLDQLERFYPTGHYITSDQSSKPQFDNVPLAHLYTFAPHKKYYIQSTEEYMKRIVNRFPTLITLTYPLDEDNINSLTNLATILCPLTKLVHLHLIILGDVEELQSNEIPLEKNMSSQIKSLKALDLKFVDEDLEFFPIFAKTQVSTLVHCFPNLQSIRLTSI